VLGLPNIGYRTSQNLFFFGGGSSYTERTGQGNDFELIPMIKVETRHPWVDHLVVNLRFQSI